MNLSYRTEFKGEVKTLKLKRNPLMHGLGYYEDQDGKQWDVRCVVGSAFNGGGKPYVNARLVDNSPYYSTATYSHSYGHHTWKPYYFEVVE